MSSLEDFEFDLDTLLSDIDSFMDIPAGVPTTSQATTPTVKPESPTEHRDAEDEGGAGGAQKRKRKPAAKSSKAQEKRELIKFDDAAAEPVAPTAPNVKKSKHAHEDETSSDIFKDSKAYTAPTTGRLKLLPMNYPVIELNLSDNHDYRLSYGPKIITSFNEGNCGAIRSFLSGHLSPTGFLSVSRKLDGKTISQVKHTTNENIIGFWEDLLSRSPDGLFKLTALSKINDSEQDPLHLKLVYRYIYTGTLLRKTATGVEEINLVSPGNIYMHVDKDGLIERIHILYLLHSGSDELAKNPEPTNLHNQSFAFAHSQVKHEGA